MIRTTTKESIIVDTPFTPEQETINVGTTKINRTVTNLSGTSGRVTGTIVINRVNVPVYCENFRMFPRQWKIYAPVIITGR